MNANPVLTCWKAYKNYIRGVVLPARNNGSKDISYWRNELFYDFLTYLVPISLIGFIPGIYMSFKQGIYVLAIADIIGFLGITAIVVVRQFTMAQRKFIFIFIVYTLSVLLLYYVSRPGSGMLYLLGSTVLCAIIYSPAAAYYSALANTVVCFVFTVLIYAGFNVPAAADYSALLWVVISSNLVVCSIICALGLNFLIKGLEDTIASKNTYHAGLIAANKALAFENEEKGKRAEELKQSERQLLKAQQVAHMGSWEFDFATNTINWSEEARRIVGLGPEDSSINTMAASLSFLHPDDASWVVDRVKSAYESSTNTNFEHRIIRKDAQVRHIYSECKFDCDAEGKPLALYGIAHDVTDKKEGEIKLMQSVGRLNQAQAVAHVGSWETDLQSQQVLWSAETYNIFGIEQKDFNGSHPAFLDFVHPDDRVKVDEAFAASLTHQSTNTIEHRIVTPAGLVKFVEERWHISVDKNRKPYKAVGTCQDITERKRAEDTLRKSEEYNHGLINSLSAHIAVVNSTGEIISVNEAWRKFTLNNSATQLASCGEGSNYFEVCRKAIQAGEAEVTEVIAGLTQVMQGDRKSFYFEYPCHSPDTLRWFAMRAVKFEGDTPMAIIAHDDITERMLGEKLLQQSQAELNAIFENTGTGFLLMDTAFNVIAFNEPINLWSKLSFGLEMLPGNNLRNLISETHKPDFDMLMAEVMGGRNLNYESSYPLLDGGLNWYQVEYRGVKSMAGTITGICIAVTNITDRKLFEVKLAESEARLNEAQTIAHIGNWDIDMASNQHTWSDGMYRIFGIEKTKASQALFESFIHASDRKMTIDCMQQAFQTLANSSFNFKFIRADEVQRFGYTEWRFELDATGKPLRLYGIVQDVTEKKEAELEIRSLNENLETRITERTVQLTEANSALEAFSYSVSHDLRAPVRAIMGFSQLITRQYGNQMNADFRDMFSHIDSSSRRMNVIIDSLLELAKFGKEKLKPEAIDLTRLFKQVWDDIIVASPNKAQFILPQMPVVHADGAMLHQVIVNLLSNAVKYSAKKKQPYVVVGYESTADTVTVYVTDNGAGFDMKFYDRLFGAFQRLHGMSEFEGTGVGLLLVKRIIERHGGTVWAESSVGMGATFYFTLPVG